MVIKPKCRGFICTTAHPEGCYKNVSDQINYVKNKGTVNGPKRVLVIGSSTGYGLSARITAAFGMGADTIGVFFEKPSTESKPGTAGFYNNIAFEREAIKSGLTAKSINGDAFSNQIKQETIRMIKETFADGKIDLVVYSLAAPKRIDPENGYVYNSVIKPIGTPYESKTVDFHTGTVSDITIDCATDREIEETIAVMGGSDWKLWMECLNQADALADGIKTISFSYIGTPLTHPIYTQGTIGKAKTDLEIKSDEINTLLASKTGKAYVSVNKALVTQASSAIPVVPLYISILYKIMKEKGIHEGCIEQNYRLFNDRLYSKDTATDEKGRIRIDDLEMRADVQNEVDKIWPIINSVNINDLADLEGYRSEFFNLFGFSRADIDYDADVSV